MENDQSVIDKKNSEFIAKIFERKREFHRTQARLPIEEKMKILIELQKIAVTIRPNEMKNGQPRQVWQIN
jgi:hypothetical protein